MGSEKFTQKVFDYEKEMEHLNATSSGRHVGTWQVNTRHVHRSNPRQAHTAAVMGKMGNAKSKGSQRDEGYFPGHITQV